MSEVYLLLVGASHERSFIRKTYTKRVDVGKRVEGILSDMDCLGISSNPNDVILDPFMGSGTILKACQELHRRAIGIEIEKKYCGIAVERLRERVLI